MSESGLTVTFADVFRASVETGPVVFQGQLIGVAASLCLLALLGGWRYGRYLLEACGLLLVVMPLLAYAIVSKLLPRETFPLLLSTIPAAGATLIYVIGITRSAEKSLSPALSLMGGTRSRWLRHYYLPYVLVGTLSAIQLSFPVSVLGATLGENMDRTDGRGLGLLIASLMPLAQPLLTTKVVLVVAAISLAIAAVLHLVQRQVVIHFGLPHLRLESNPYKGEDMTEDLVLPILSLLMGVLAWFLISLVGPAELVPSPAQTIAKAFSWAWLSGGALQDVLLTFFRTITALFITLALAYLLAALRDTRFFVAAASILAVGYIVQAVPINAVISLLRNIGMSSIVLATAIGIVAGIFPAFIVFSDRRRALPVSVAQFLTIYAARFLRVERSVYFPWLEVWWPIAVKVAAPCSLSAVLVCEFMLSGDGIGHRIHALHGQAVIDGLYVYFLYILIFCTFIPFLASAIGIAQRRYIARQGFSQPA